MAILESRQVRESPDKIEKNIKKLYQDMHNTDEEEKIKNTRKKIQLRRKDLVLAKSDLGYLSFEKLHDLIQGISEKKRDYYSTIHYDNYYKTRKEKTFFDQIWENPRLEEIKEYTQYQKSIKRKNETSNPIYFIPSCSSNVLESKSNRERPGYYGHLQYTGGNHN